MAVFRIDELAREAGLTARNVRAYQERGLLPPPRLRGRIGYYDESHLGRLRLISQLLARGYTLAVIDDLLTAWQRGRDLTQLLGLEKVLTDPWSDESPAYYSAEELLEMFRLAPSPETLEWLREAEERGFLAKEGGRYKSLTPRLMGLAGELAAVGVPLEDVFEISDGLHEDLAVVARRLVGFAIEQGAGPSGRLLADQDSASELAEFIRRLKPLAYNAVEAVLARTMEAEVRRRLGDQIVNEIRGDWLPTVEL